MGVGERSGASDAFKSFDSNYERSRGRSWSDDTLNGLLSFLAWPSGIGRLRNVRDRHSPASSADYAVEIVDELEKGKLVIVDQSVGVSHRN